ncbi:hypothetical protein ACFZAC_00125 [Pseudomonas fluorescens]|uniref:hypothetical protein n=1 Tax=Pseudomonas fluorescens TaxID=294 RepID=UPI00374A950E
MRLPQGVEKSAHKKTFQPSNRHKSVGDDNKARPSDCLLKRAGDAQTQALERMKKRLETLWLLVKRGELGVCRCGFFRGFIVSGC